MSPETALARVTMDSLLKCFQARGSQAAAPVECERHEYCRRSHSAAVPCEFSAAWAALLSFLDPPLCSPMLSRCALRTAGERRRSHPGRQALCAAAGQRRQAERRNRVSRAVVTDLSGKARVAAGAEWLCMAEQRTLSVAGHQGRTTLLDAAQSPALPAVAPALQRAAGGARQPERASGLHRRQPAGRVAQLPCVQVGVQPAHQMCRWAAGGCVAAVHAQAMVLAAQSISVALVHCRPLPVPPLSAHLSPCAVNPLLR